jgi:hypothetical protein
MRELVDAGGALGHMPNRIVMGHPQIISIINHRSNTAPKLISILIPIIPIPPIFLFNNSSKNLDLTTDHHGKAFTPHWLLYARQSRTITPFVKLAPEGVGFYLDEAEFAGGEEAVPTRGVDMRD